MTTIYTNRSNAIRAARAKLGKGAEQGVDFEIVGSTGGAYTFNLLTSHLAQQAVEGKIEVVAEPVTEPDVEHPLSGGSEFTVGSDLAMMEEMDGDGVMPKDDHDLEIPATLKISQADRAAAWERTPPKPAPAKLSFAKPAKAKADKPKGENKIGAVLAAAKSDTGVSVPMIHQMTGWKKIGGFFTAAKRAGLTLSKTRADGVTVYRAA